MTGDLILMISTITLLNQQNINQQFHLLVKTQDDTVSVFLNGWSSQILKQEL